MAIVISLPSTITVGTLPDLKALMTILNQIINDVNPELVEYLSVEGTGGSGYIDYYAQSPVPGHPAAGVCRLYASTANGFTRLVQDNEATTNIDLGQDSVFIAKNTSGADIAAGAAVYTSGSTGNVPNIALAKADAAATSASVGITVDAITNNSFGQVMRGGVLNNVDTSAFSSGDRVWVSPTVAGALTSTRPSGTDLEVGIGSILVSGVGNGSIEVLVSHFIGNRETGTSESSWTAQGTVATGAYTVATLPAAGTAGRRAYVTDATSPTFLGALTGGGSVVTPVFDNGTAWVSA